MMAIFEQKISFVKIFESIGKLIKIALFEAHQHQDSAAYAA